MPEIKIKHLVSFSSEDKVHKAENILKSELYRKWKCGTAGEKSASFILQFEKAEQIHSIDIGNESSGFVEVLVGRSSDPAKQYHVLLVASSFMSPLESRNENHTNRVRMFGQDKLSQNLKDEKWDCVQVVCTQPFNKNITYGLSFIKFHSPPEKIVERPVEKDTKKAALKLGAFRIKYEDDEEDETPPLVGSWLDRKKEASNELSTSLNEPSFSKAFLASTSTTPKVSQSSSPRAFQQSSSLKRKPDSNEDLRLPAKREASISRVNREKVGYKDILGSTSPSSSPSSNSNTYKNGLANISKNIGKMKNPDPIPSPSMNNNSRAPNTIKTGKDKKPFRKIMEKVVFVISGFVNPLRGEIREKALEMGAKYKGDWDRTCTHLICAFVNTPKYIQVRSNGGRVVNKDWIMDSHRKQTEMPWRKYMLGTYSRDTTEESESEEEKSPVQQKQVTKPQMPKGKSLFADDVSTIVQKNRRRIPSDDSATEDEETLQDYMADTDADSGEDTEDEIMKIQARVNSQRKAANSLKKSQKDSSSEDDSDSLLPKSVPAKPDSSDLPLPDLPNLFKKRHFFLYGDFLPKRNHDLERYITAYDGVIEDYMSDTVKYVVTESKWDTNFEEALDENEDLIFVKPEWVFKCHESGKLLPYQPYIVIPNS